MEDRGKEPPGLTNTLPLEAEPTSPALGVEPTMPAFEPHQSNKSPIAQRELPPGAQPQRVTAAAAQVSMGNNRRIAPGIRVGQFELIRELGSGGMGRVYLARDTRLARLVALKFLRMASRAQIGRFLVEARATAQCRHDNIVVIYEADEWKGMPYLALEYLEGRPLSRVLDSGPLPYSRAISLMRPVVHALACAHELGIVHRDLKPENIFITSVGQVKVLDFGIAKLYGEPQAELVEAPAEKVIPLVTETGAYLGTAPYMSPEQWGAGKVDHRTDLWAIGVLFWEMIAGRHPIARLRGKERINIHDLRSIVLALDEPLPSIDAEVADLPGELIRIIDACLVKRVQDRLGSAAELAEALDGIASNPTKRLRADACPYPGMTPFEQDDNDLFFGREREIKHVRQRLLEAPLVAIVGQSGVGKSSFVRAGLLPALGASDESWKSIVVRPGRSPLSALAGVLHEHGSFVTADELRDQPGVFGTILRARAQSDQRRILLFVDQFEELYTLRASFEERMAFTECLAGVADHASTPLRLVISLRSDLLDRVAENPAFMDRVTSGLFFLTPVTPAGMRLALCEPLRLTDYWFESEVIVDEMIAELAGTHGAMSLLQFVAGILWDARDRDRKLLTTDSYRRLGGVAGTLAAYADDVVGAMTPRQQRLTRAIFERLVTRDNTKSMAERTELEQLSSSVDEVYAVLDALTRARLLTIREESHTESGSGGVVEIIHESLLTAWPRLRRWREERADETAFRDELRAAAKQWDAKQRPAGLLWRGEAAVEAQRFADRCSDRLPERDRQYLEAVIALASRSARRRRRVVIGSLATLTAIVLAGVVALVTIQRAERTAQQNRLAAEAEAKRAREAEADVRSKLETIRKQQEAILKTESKRRAASNAARAAAANARAAEKKAVTAIEARDLTYEQLKAALVVAKRERAKAREAAKKAGDAAVKAQVAASAERAAKEALRKLVEEKNRQLKRLNRRLD